ncbi:hypothetical protein CDAR_452171 [Caerostris darwini]|uniref:Uncharacterized protein n=1 Tax=Caerostris darwini TaxID=1538125 RepID=A0AAV4PNB6_9ARAC|nr:hypothetical protein CDAR_452171 [Caerostris darwini]
MFRKPTSPNLERKRKNNQKTKENRKEGEKTNKRNTHSLFRRKGKATGKCAYNQLASSTYSSRDPPRRTSPVTLVAIETRKRDPRSYRGLKEIRRNRGFIYGKATGKCAYNQLAPSPYSSRDPPRRTSPVTLVAIETRDRDPRSYRGQNEMWRKRVFTYVKVWDYFAVVCGGRISGVCVCSIFLPIDK